MLKRSVDIAIVMGGGGEGSGSAIARRFGREGMWVLVCDMNPSAGNATVESIASAGGHASFCETDVRSRDQIERAFAFAANLGTVKVVVNNASDVASVHFDAPLGYWDEIISTDFLGAMWSTRLGIDAVRAGGGGAIVNVSSTSAFRERSDRGCPIYDVAKLAILRLSLRMEFLKAENIRVNCIIPHWIAVPSIVDYVSALSRQERARRGVPDRLIPVNEIADQVYRLATDTALAGQAVIWPNGGKPELYHAQTQANLS
jgi:NAD(P)-dependent dehydrogenase (short-subunit alcohol dehydrogenase family)